MQHTMCSFFKNNNKATQLKRNKQKKKKTDFQNKLYKTIKLF